MPPRRGAKVIEQDRDAREKEAHDELDARLDEALRLTFPASDPVALEQKTVAGAPKRVKGGTAGPARDTPRDPAE